jgi:hypothetical protein
MADPISMEHSTLPWFNKIVELNQNNGWLNPQFIPITTEEFKDEYFKIQLDDYLEIESNYEVEIFRVSKRWGDLNLYCRVAFKMLCP